MGVAFTAPAPFGGHQTVAVGHKLFDEFPRRLIVYQGAQRDADDQRATDFAGAVLAVAGLAVVGLEEVAPAKIAEGAFVAGGLEDHVTAPAAVAAIGTAPGLVAGSAEAYAAGAAAAAMDRDLRLIGKGFQVAG